MSSLTDYGKYVANSISINQSLVNMKIRMFLLHELLTTISNFLETLNKVDVSIFKNA